MSFLFFGPKQTGKPRGPRGPYKKKDRTIQNVPPATPQKSAQPRPDISDDEDGWSLVRQRKNKLKLVSHLLGSETGKYINGKFEFGYVAGSEFTEDGEIEFLIQYGDGTEGYMTEDEVMEGRREYVYKTQADPRGSLSEEGKDGTIRGEFGDPPLSLKGMRRFDVPVGDVADPPQDVGEDDDVMWGSRCKECSAYKGRLQIAE